MGLYTEIPPRRSLDYTAFKIKNIDEAKDNYLQVKKGKYKIVFNKYKNSSRLGSQVIDIPPAFGKILKKFIDKNPYDYLIVNNVGKPVLQNHITKILNRLFDKQVSSSLLRHSYLTHKFGDVDLKDLEQTTEDMGNKDVARSLKYVSKEEAGKERMGKKLTNVV
jgi:site-specific recombinase XerD